jgi:YVTN family beta-propeller protein
MAPHTAQYNRPQILRVGRIAKTESARAAARSGDKGRQLQISADHSCYSGNRPPQPATWVDKPTSHEGLRTPPRPQGTLAMLKRKNLLCNALVLTICGFGVMKTQHGHAENRLQHSSSSGKIVVANRGSGTITVIDADGATHLANVPLPASTRPAEPMYVVNTTSFGQNLVWVGDRANNRVVVFDGNTFDVIATVPAGAGVFHMWADPNGRQLWVVNDIDNTTTVIDIAHRRVIATVPMPEDLIAAGARPHDVVLDTFGRYAYVTIVGSALASDVIVQFDTQSKRELRRMPVGKDPHVSFNSKTRQVFSPNQGTNNVFVLDAKNLSVQDVINIPGAHGAITSNNGRWFFTTNISGGGNNAVYSLNARNRSVNAPVGTAFNTPHNVAVTPDGKLLYVTHSGATNNQVSVIRVDSHGETSLLGNVQAGTNPFGLAFVR